MYIYIYPVWIHGIYHSTWTRIVERPGFATIISGGFFGADFNHGSCERQGNMGVMENNHLVIRGLQLSGSPAPWKIGIFGDKM